MIKDEKNNINNGKGEIIEIYDLIRNTLKYNRDNIT
jgi:hypothetical protein